MQRDPLIAELARIVGADHVLVDPALRAGFETDWTGRYHGTALAVVRPADTEQVAAVLRACRAARTGVVPQGGNTGLVGGGVPRDGTVLLSLARLGDLGPVDTLAGEVVAGAGVTLARLAAHARATGLEPAVDFGARDSATVGGMIATNAGGIHAFCHGPMRDQVTGIEAVTADGSILRRLDRPRKDNTGYSLPALLAGSEGTLAVITAARLRLVPVPARLAVALLALPDVATAVRVAGELRRALPHLRAAELVLADGLELVVRHAGAARPFASYPPACLLVEVAGDADPVPALADALAATDGILDAVLAGDTAARDRLWQLREGQPDAIGREGVPHKLDVSLPAARLAEFVARIGERVTAVAPGARTIVFGHVLDGNLHVNVLGPDPADDTVDDAVLRLVVELGGSISAEHGVGVAKVRWLALDRSAAELAAMRVIKHALDPDGILNPGVLLDPADG
ncbi:MAG: FAD-linked oxidase [Chloroflexi bacterium RBG_16_72_14]|nr:MAG: FAD-linked oxidase [Chloroflexi bacterium RBG_16_72_14]